jgi:hypothetical protein
MRIPMIALAVLALGAGTVGAKTIDVHASETFPVESGALLRLSHGDGDVEITPWDRDEVEVEVVYRADYTMVGVGKEPDFTVEMRQEGPVIRVTGRETGVAMVGIFLSVTTSEYRYTVKAPAYLAVESRGQDGDFSATGLRGDLRCRLDDGDVILQGIEADRVEVEVADGDVHGENIAARSASFRLDDGDLRLRGCSGGWDVRTEDGDATLRDHASGTLGVRTADGDISVHLVAGERADVEIEAEDGDVELVVAPDVSTAFLLSSGDGRIRVGAEGVRNLEQDRSRVYGEIGSAEGSIRATVEDGRLSLEVAGGGA